MNKKWDQAHLSLVFNDTLQKFSGAAMEYLCDDITSETCALDLTDTEKSVILRVYRLAQVLYKAPRGQHLYNPVVKLAPGTLDWDSAPIINGKKYYSAVVDDFNRKLDDQNLHINIAHHYHNSNLVQLSITSEKVRYEPYTGDPRYDRNGTLVTVVENEPSTERDPLLSLSEEDNIMHLLRYQRSEYGHGWGYVSPLDTIIARDQHIEKKFDFVRKAWCVSVDMRAQIREMQSCIRSQEKLPHLIKVYRKLVRKLG